MRLRYQFSESYVPEPQKIDKTGMAHSSAVPAGLSKNDCADKLSFMREVPNNPSPGERVPPVRTLGAGVECGRKGWIRYAETDLVRRNPSAGLRLYRNLGYLPHSTSVFKIAKVLAILNPPSPREKGCGCAAKR